VACEAAGDADLDDPDPDRNADLIQIHDRVVAIRAEQVAAGRSR
jgi:hypothetical protein